MRLGKTFADGRGWLELTAGPLLAMTSVLALTATHAPAEAQVYRTQKVSHFAPHVRPARSDGGRGYVEAARPRAVVKTAKAEPEARRPQAAATPAQPSAPLLLMVNLRKQNITVYSGTSEVARSPISSGQSGYETPSGIFSVIQKNKEHYSNLYNDAPMPNMQRITWSGVALHAGNLPGYPASHGCVRLPSDFSSRLFGMTQMGTRVIVTHGDTAPSEFTHQQLFAPLPDATTAQLPATPLLQTASIGADAPPAAMRTQASVAAERAAERKRLGDEVRSRQDAHAAAIEALKAANLALEQTQADLKMLRTETERAKHKVNAATAASETLAAKLAELGRRATETQDNAGLAKLATTEDELEGKLLESLRWSDLLRGEAADLAEETDAAAALLAVRDAERAAAHSAAAEAAAQLKTALNAQSQFMKEDARRALPVSIFISRRTSKLYVRQGFEPILEAPVAIRAADAPLGTHVFTAIGYAGSKSSLRWNVVGLPDAPTGSVAAQRTVAERNAARKSGEALAPTARAPAPPMTPGSALDRIEIPAETRQTIEELIKPGSSLIISDLPASSETGRGTDFVILTR